MIAVFLIIAIDKGAVACPPSEGGFTVSGNIRGWKEARMEREKVWREFMELTTEDQRKVAGFTASLRGEPMNLEDEPFIGLWSGREDSTDSTGRVRETRERERDKRRV